MFQTMQKLIYFRPFISGGGVEASKKEEIIDRKK